MKTQFFYTRKEKMGSVQSTVGLGERAIYSYKRDSFNLNAVIRSIEMADGSVLVLLNDIHERTVENPNINVRNNKVAGVTRKRDTFQSEIYLSKEDGERFYRASAVDEPLTFNTEDNGVQETIGEESLSGDSRGTNE